MNMKKPKIALTNEQKVYQFRYSQGAEGKNEKGEQISGKQKRCDMILV